MPKSSRLMQYVVAATASLSYAAYGTFMTWPSTTLPILQGEGSPIPLTADEGSWLASINSLTMLVGVFGAGYSVDIIGRKKLVLASAVPLLAWWLMVAFSDSYGMLLAARAIGSIGGGLISTVMPMYLCEVADPDIRGVLVAIHLVLMQMGTLFIYCIGPYLPIPVVAGICASVPVIFFIAFIWMPESPYFLLSRHREKDAKRILLRLKGKLSPEDLDSELTVMHETIRQKNESKGKLKDLFTVPVHRRTLLIMTGFILLQASSGAIAIMTYTTSIFEASGSNLDPNVSSIILASVLLVTSVGASFIIDRFGRRTLAMASLMICSACLTAEGAYFYVNEVYGDVNSAFDWLPLAALMGFQVSFGLGAGPVMSPMIGEIYHVSVKGAAASINTTVIALYGFFLKKMFQVVSDNVGAYWSFWGFAVLCVCATAYVYFLLPETKGKTFAHINEELDARFGKHHPKSVSDTKYADPK
ncbi:facilitated trehalose transporter Tret1-like [Schistocerca gregaria]|uniref:facilitated trehalose transporter Tret1-like n=1 Tax=Schistocerca gregaria TaxID=7010 RepID=UPI00211F23E7|nr:facilitated trehalose transporter Tret1-like [Schistocerca gregaria]